MSDLVLDQASVDKSSKKKKEFRINSQQFFLTYPQCPLDPKVVLDHILIEEPLEHYVIAQEQHKDGNMHIHAYLLFSKKLNVRNEKKFDITIEGVTYHPNMQGVRSWKNVVKYVTKDGNYLTNYDDSVIDKLIRDNMKVGDIYTKARELAKESKVSEALSVLEHSKTVRDLVIHGNAIQKNLRSLAVKRKAPEYSIEDFRLNFNWDKKKTLIMWGPTDTGKTSLAKALLPKALFIRHIDRLKDYDEEEFEGLILDDMSFKHWPREAQIHLVDIENDSHINVKHGMAVVPAGTPRIITTNNMPAEILLADDGAIARRIQIIHIENSVKRRREERGLLESGDLEDPFSWVRERNVGAQGGGAGDGFPK